MEIKIKLKNVNLIFFNVFRKIILWQIFAYKTFN